MAGTISPLNETNDVKLSRLTPPGPGLAGCAKDGTASLGEQVSGAAASVARTAEGAAEFVGHKAEDATAAVGGGLKSLGHAIREHTPRHGLAGDASSAVATTLENTGRYLQEEGLQGLAKDVTNLIRRNPIPALLVGVGVGFLIARASTRRS